MNDYLPVIGITMGDAAGVGPEIIVKSLASAGLHRFCRPLVIGDAQRLEKADRLLGGLARVRRIEDADEARFEPGVIDCIDLGLIPDDLPFGVLSPVAGDAAYQYVARAVNLAKAGKIDAICTAPLNKEALHAGGHKFPGHTELLAHLTNVDEVSMMLVAPKLRVIHVTTHIGIIDAIRRIEPGLVQRTIERGHETLVRSGIPQPRIGVCGINSINAVTARKSPGLAISCTRLPVPEFAIWSWFWMKCTNVDPGKSNPGVPRRFPCHLYRCPWYRYPHFAHDTSSCADPR